MHTIQLRSVVSGVAILLAVSLQPVAAQQSKPVAKKTAARTAPAANCSRKSGDCCKGTPTRFAVLATTVAQSKQVKKD